MWRPRFADISPSSYEIDDDTRVTDSQRIDLSLVNKHPRSKQPGIFSERLLIANLALLYFAISNRSYPFYAASYGEFNPLRLNYETDYFWIEIAILN